MVVVDPDPVPSVARTVGGVSPLDCDVNAYYSLVRHDFYCSHHCKDFVNYADIGVHVVAVADNDYHALDLN